MPHLSDIVVGSLCFTAGAAGLYYFTKMVRKEMRNSDAVLTSDLKHTMPVDSSSMDPSLRTAAEGFSVEESPASHQSRNLELKTSVSYLTSTSVVLQKALSFARTIGLNLIEEQEQQQVALAEAERTNMQSMESIPQLEKDNSEKEANSKLSEVNSKSVKITTDSLAEVEKKYRQAVQTNIQVEKKLCCIKKNAKALQEKLSGMRKNCKDLSREQKQQQISLAEAEKRYKEVMESNAQLQKEKSDLMSQIQALRESERKVNNKRSETKSNIAKTTTNSRAKVEAENRVLLTTNEELKNKNSDLNNVTRTLKDSVRELEEALSETRGNCYELTWELDSEIQAHNNLKSEFSQMAEKHAELLKEREREQVSLAEAQRKYTVAMESVAQLVTENSNLTSQMDSLQGAVRQLKEELSEARTKYD